MRKFGEAACLEDLLEINKASYCQRKNSRLTLLVQLKDEFIAKRGVGILFYLFTIFCSGFNYF